MGDSSERLDFVSATFGSEVEHASSSTSYLSAVEEQIERSKAHWSTLTDHSGYTDEEELDYEVSNLQEFRALQDHPTWGNFFANFTGDGISTRSNHRDFGELVVGKKFAEGGQAELYEAQVKWNDPRNVELDQSRNVKYVLKVFKEGTLLKHVKSQLPQGVLLDHARLMKNMTSPTRTVVPQYTSTVQHGILLKGGSFAFLMRKQDFDLRTVIDRNMKLRSGQGSGPFSKEEAEFFMYFVALGVERLHSRDIVHRDLKASNVLVKEFKSGWSKWKCLVADYECSIGVVGTNFFRAPEVLLACKDRKINERPEVFSRASDVYSYGMTCYEILTGQLPFEDHPLRYEISSLSNLVISDHLRPEVPQYVDDWARQLLGRCWESNPTARPRIGEVLDVLLANSSEVTKFENGLKKHFGENFRWKIHDDLKDDVDLIK